MERAGLVEYEVGGQGEPVLTIHGAIVADSFNPLSVEPALNEYRVIRYRRRGYGDSAMPSSPPTIEQDATDALLLLEHLDIPQAHVVAHSGRGTNRRPARDPGAGHGSLVGAAGTGPPVGGDGSRLRQVHRPARRHHREGNSSKAVHLWMSSTGGPAWRTEIERLLPGAGDRAIEDAVGTFEGDLVATRSWDFEVAGAAGITQPVLYLVSSANAVRLEPVIDIFRPLPHTEFLVIDGADHNLQITKAAPVAEAIGKFLRGNPM